MAHESSSNENTVSNRVMELVVAAAFLAVSVVVMYDSNRLGASWAADGPEAGYFPFYIGLIMFVASAMSTRSFSWNGSASLRFVSATSFVLTRLVSSRVSVSRAASYAGSP